ncbi:major histocompatibility complex class I-related gene protein-like isoform X1 [Antennarius striatus]|uniref:major histocompatibility complex class I-related gene protein-like isoform X1 n=1 Tax=Antennarius striatus TaxID=241820 RepID=UPI0035B213A6
MRQVTMTTLVLVVLLGTGVPGAAGVTHSLKYFRTASSGVPNFPEFVSVGMIDDVQIVHYDSNTKRSEPKQDWMEKITADDPEYWNQQTRINEGNQEVFKVNIETLKKCFNQSEGFHIVQRMTGCQWDDETGEVTGFDQYGYNGEDFLVLDLKTETWIAPRPQALITKHRWDHDRGWMDYVKHYYTKECPEWGRKYLENGRSSLLRTVNNKGERHTGNTSDPSHQTEEQTVTPGEEHLKCVCAPPPELPSVFLLQKTPSSPVSCFATGFYPDRAALFWRRDGEELHEEVDHGEILPNHDGTFQTSVDLNLSSVAPEDWRRYDCVFQLEGVEDDLVTRLDKGKIWTNWEEPTDVTPPTTTIIIIIIAVVVLALVVMAAIGFKLSRQRTAKRGSVPEDSSELSERLQPGVGEQPEVGAQPEVGEHQNVI